MPRDAELSGYELIGEGARKYDNLVATVQAALANGRPQVPERLLDDLLAVEANMDEIASRGGLRPLELRYAANRIKSQAYESITTCYRSYLGLLELSGRRKR